MYRMASNAQIQAEVARFQAEVGSAFSVTPNSYGVRIECNTCHAAATHDRAYRFAREHSHSHFTAPRPADYRSVTLNADGTRNTVLGWA